MLRGKGHCDALKKALEPGYPVTVLLETMAGKGSENMIFLTFGTGLGAGISLSGSSGSAIEMKVVKPQQFDSVSQIADHLLSRRTVVLNLENTNKETARRLIDFLSGVAYSINGQLKKIASNAYVITPDNVDVSGEQLRERTVEQAPVVQDQAADPNEETSF